MGRGIAEHIVSGTDQKLDLSAFGFDRILAQTALPETVIISPSLAKLLARCAAKSISVAAKQC